MTTPDFRARVDAIVRGYPGTRYADGPDELHSWKVGSKMFACFGDDSPGVSVKTEGAETAAMLIEAGVAEKARYFHRSWVRVPENATEDELNHRLARSYDLVRASLTKAERAGLPQREGN